MCFLFSLKKGKDRRNQTVSGRLIGDGRSFPLMSDRREYLDQFYFELKAESGKEISLAVRNDSKYTAIMPNWMRIYRLEKDQWTEIRPVSFGWEDIGIGITPGTRREQVAKTVTLVQNGKTELEAGKYKVTIQQVQLMEGKELIRFFDEIPLYFTIS